MRLFDTLNAYQKTAAMKAALELDLFTAVGQGAVTPPALAKQCDASERGMRILADFMVVEGFLTKTDGLYGLTQDAAIFLSRNSPAYLGEAVVFMNSTMLMEHFRDMTAVVRKGGSVSPSGGTIAPEHPVWIEFARGMDALMVPAAQAIAGLIPKTNSPMKVLDIAAGHGRFGITVAQQHPTAQITALDWKAVLELAQEHATKGGVADRYQLLPGSAFEVDFGTGYDVVLITNFLHHFDPATCESLLRKVHASLKPGGIAVTLEFVPNEDRVSPPGPASFSLVMLAGTPAGDAYTFRELDAMLKNAGFAENRAVPLQGLPETVIISKA
jgi:2-polyprenyl-3-methyl-5-hydroxy-6-metoxy-1,4-benzoquinol methylase